MAATTGPFRISYRHRPSGEHKYRLISVSHLATTKAPSLVYSSEVQDSDRQRRASGEKQTFDCHGNPTNSRSGFGARPRSTNFTKLAKEAVRDACAVLDQTYGKQCLFITGTLPGNSVLAIDALAAYSGAVVQNIKQWVRDNFPSVRCVFVWEFQDRGALHLHGCVGGPDPEQLQALANAWNQKWYRLLSRIGSTNNVDLFDGKGGRDYKRDGMFIRTDAQWVTKSVGNYLSKYLSKSAGAAMGSGYFAPSRWWSVDNWIRAEALRRTICVLSSVQPYLVAKTNYVNLVEALAELAENVYGWCERYARCNLTTVFFLRASPT